MRRHALHWRHSGPAVACRVSSNEDVRSLTTPRNSQKQVKGDLEALISWRKREKRREGVSMVAS